MSQSHEFSVNLTLLENYAFKVDFGEAGEIITDEPSPLGDDKGPNPMRLLAASIANCLAASLLFAIRKFKSDAGEVTAKISGQLVRVDGRWRVTDMVVDLFLGTTAESIKNIDRIISQFEDFCVVTQSVREGIAVSVNVKDSEGKLLST